MLLSCYHGEESELCGILWDLIECCEDKKYTKDDQEASSVSAPSIPEGTRSGLLSPALDLLCLSRLEGWGVLSVFPDSYSQQKTHIFAKNMELRDGTGLAHWT